MGAGGLEINIENILTSLLFSLTKIESLRRYFYSNNFKGKLCEALSNYIKNNCNEQIKIYVKLAKIEIIRKNKDRDRINTEMIFKYILEEINKELEKEKKSNNLIKELFYGYYEFIKENKKEEKEKKYTEKPLIFSINFSQLNSIDFRIDGKEENRISLNEIIKKKFNENMINEHPELRNNNIVKMPEICAIIFSNVIDEKINYYLSQEIRGVPYELIYFMIDEEEEKGKLDFFKENSFWYEYRSKNNTIYCINNIKEIKANAQIYFYQKRNNLIKHFLTNKSIISEEQKRISDLMNGHIIPEHFYENYYLINKNLLNELKTNLNDKTLSEENIYCKTRFIPKEVNLLEIGAQVHKDTNLKIPKNFVMLQENVYKKILENSDVDYAAKKKDNVGDYEFKFRKDFLEKKYQVKFGENLAFIKMEEDNYFMKKENNEQERIYICSYNEKEETFEVEIIMKYYKKGEFEEDLKKYISNRGGMEYFYKIKNLNIKKSGFQDIKENEEKTGELANLANMKTHLDMNRYKMLDSPNDFKVLENVNKYKYNNKFYSSEIYENAIIKVANEKN